MARRRHLVLAISMALLGACGMIYEYVFGMVGNYLIGGRYEQILLIVGLMLFAMGAGAGVQQFITTRLTERFLLLELLLGLIGGGSVMLIYLLFRLGGGHGVATYVAATLIGMLIGAEIPLLMRLNQTYAPELRTNAGQLLALDNFGALVGAVLFVSLLLTHVSLPRLAFALGLGNTLVTGLVWRAFRGELQTPRRYGLAIGAVALVLAFGCGFADVWQAALDQPNPVACGGVPCTSPAD
jgi:spermidine synthase